MTCGEAYRLAVRNAITAAEQAQLRAHLGACEACRETVALVCDPTVAGGSRGSRHASTLDIGDRVGNYELERVLGEGGMGVVFAATHVDMRKRVAIKILHREHVGDSEVTARFLRETVMAAQLRSEHVCRATSVGQSPDGAPYIVLELLEGEDLARVLERERAIPVAIAVDEILQACVGLAEAHARGIIHRDIKPANLFRTRAPDGSSLIKVLDFGIAKARLDLQQSLTITGVQLGSVPYMSPEQLRSSKAVDARTDIWSLGATLHHLIAGDLPFPVDASLGEVTIRIWTDPPQPLPPDVPRGLADALVRALEKAAADRHPDVAAFARAIAPFGSQQATVTADRAERILKANA